MVEKGFSKAFCCTAVIEGCLPNASGHEVSLGAGSFCLERPESPSFQGLAGQCFSGVDGTAVFSSDECPVSLACGATRVEECSCVFVGKKSMVSTLDRLCFCDDARRSCLPCSCCCCARHGDRFSGEGVGGTAPCVVLDLVTGSYVGLFGFKIDPFLTSSGGGGLISIALERRLADPGGE